MAYEFITYEKKGRIAYLTINRPEVLNSIHPPASAELSSAWDDFAADADSWVAIFTGAGEKAFSAGNDLVAMSQLQQQGISAVGAIYSRAPFGGITRNFECWKPMIAAINGYCLAGGLEMALSCDIRIASEHSVFGLPEVTRAIIPGAGGTQRLPRIIPSGAALELILTGGRFDAAWALRYGLVNQVVPAAEVMPRSVAMAEAICKNGPLAVRLAKEAVVRGLSLPMDEGLRLEGEQSRKVLGSEDAMEGPLAFAQKRKPNYKGR